MQFDSELNKELVCIAIYIYEQFVFLSCFLLFVKTAALKGQDKHTVYYLHTIFWKITLRYIVYEIGVILFVV